MSSRFLTAFRPGYAVSIGRRPCSLIRVNFPYFNSAALFRSYRRSAAFQYPPSPGKVDLLHAQRSAASCIHFLARLHTARGRIGFPTSNRRFPSRSFSARSLEAASDSFLRSLALDFDACMIRRRISSRSAGGESISVRNLAAASSTRSMALSGRKRSVM